MLILFGNFYGENIKMRNKIGIIIVSCFLLLVASQTQAASLYLSPSLGTHTVGSTFSVSVYVSSPDQAANAASGVILFPQDKLEVISLSKVGSIITQWMPREPGFSNAKGEIHFEGIVFNPGFTGSAGKIININFKVKAAGIAPLSFSSSSVLANDGQGTNILTSLGKASFSLGIVPSAVPEATTPSETRGAPPAPQISSPTHPNPDKWYAKKDAEFTWKVPRGVTAVRVLVNKVSNAVPWVTYSPAIQVKKISDLEDGVWYFHVRLKNATGWGGVSHFRLQIDTEKPEHFEIRKITRNDKTDPRVKLIFKAEDKTSGIDHYEIQIDNGSTKIWKDNGTGIFETPVLGPGEHNLIARAVDKAGNESVAVTQMKVLPIKPPVITHCPRKLFPDSVLSVKGTTYPNAQVVIWLQKDKDDPQSQIVRSDNYGNFTFIAGKKLESGIYKLWTEVIDKRGARSKPTEKITIAVEPPVILKIGNWAINVLNIIIPLIALTILLLIVIFYGWHKFSLFKKRIYQENKETEEAMRKAFKILKKKTEAQVATLDGKPDLSPREKKIYNNLKKALKASEKSIAKEIKDVEREVKKK